MAADFGCSGHLETSVFQGLSGGKICIWANTSSAAGSVPRMGFSTLGGWRSDAGRFWRALKRTGALFLAACFVLLLRVRGGVCWLATTPKSCSLALDAVVETATS